MDRSKVYVYRYDLTQGMAAQYSQSMMGTHFEAVWHTAIVAFGREFYFDGGVGIDEAAPGTTRFGRPLHIDDHGAPTVSEAEFRTWVRNQYATKYGPNDYSLLHRNCNNFSEDAIQFITGGRERIDDSVTSMIPRMLSTPLGQLLRPSLEAMSMRPGHQQSTLLAQQQGAPQATSMLQGPAPSDTLEDELSAAVAAIGSCPTEVAGPAATTMKTITDNIINNPTEAKYGSLNKDSATFLNKIAPAPAAVKLLVLIGFDAPPSGQQHYKLNPQRANAEALQLVSVLLESVLVDVTSSENMEKERQAEASKSVEGVSWMRVSPSKVEIPSNAVACGIEGGKTMYLVRRRSQLRQDQYCFGKMAQHFAGGANFLSDDGASEEGAGNRLYEVLCQSSVSVGLAWLPLDLLPECRDAAVPSGTKDVLCARGEISGNYHPGVVVADGCVVVPYGGGPRRCASGQVLVLTSRVPQEHAGSVIPLSVVAPQPNLECGGIDSIERLLALDVKVPNRPSALLPRQTLQQRSEEAPKLALCHDFRGGYCNADQCCSVADGSDLPYTVRHWEAVDLFIYFSHCRVTIPPREWIDSAHRHGVPVLGTFITEHDSGAHDLAMILKDDEKMMEVISKMVEITVECGFDGWLINIENDCRTPQPLRAFVELFSAMLHSSIPHAKVLWYDAVTDRGNLAWQNTLNDANQCFFDSCDGIFTNYWWSEALATVAKGNAGKRPRDVYMGTDVYGRNTFLGGGLNSYRAIEVAARTGLSNALFAPGWTVDIASSAMKNQNLNAAFSVFQRRDDALWSPILAEVAPSPLCLVATPSHAVWTSFSRGLGSSFAVAGDVVSNRGWSSIGLQGLFCEHPLVREASQPAALFGDQSVVLSSSDEQFAFSIRTQPDEVPVDTVLEWKLCIVASTTELSVTVGSNATAAATNVALRNGWHVFTFVVPPSVLSINGATVTVRSTGKDTTSLGYIAFGPASAPPRRLAVSVNKDGCVTNFGSGASKVVELPL